MIGQPAALADAKAVSVRNLQIMSHWFRLADGTIIEHWANRDDLAMAQQLGWIPPSPRYLVRMALARRNASTPRRRAAAGRRRAGEPQSVW
jgi:hypothetical protein